jgi:signal peptidase I
MHIYFDFPFILTSLTILSGLLALIDIIFFAPNRKKTNKKQPLIFEYARSFFPMLLIVLIIRSFIIQPYRVPSGSLSPTVLPGDFIAVNQFAYGLRLPVINYKIVPIGEPRRGDIVLFRWPENPKLIFVKRVVGLPGDRLAYHDKVLEINGIKAQQQFLHKDLSVDPNKPPTPVLRKLEDLLGIKHQIFIHEVGGQTQNFNIIVPEGQYFMMGDNRDDSDDSRYWGFVPEENLIGKAFLIWMSLDAKNYKIRWTRIGDKVS